MRHVLDIYISRRISDLLQKRRFEGLDKNFGKSSSTGVLPQGASGNVYSKS
jgi:hypothetical protein